MLAIVLTHNNEDIIAACLESLRWADAILVFDSYSQDATVQIAELAGARVLRHEFVDWSRQRDAALSAAAALYPHEEWIYFVDSDECSTPEQAAEIRRVTTDPTMAGYWVPRHNYIFGRLTRGAGWFPDYQLRLLRRERAHYDLTREVHELVILDGPAGHLQAPLEHYNYKNARQFRDKQRRYTDHAAREMHKQGIRAKPQNYLLQPIRHFWWRFVTLGGWRDGLHGLRLSLLMAWYEFKKYLILGRLR